MPVLNKAKPMSSRIKPRFGECLPLFKPTFEGPILSLTGGLY